MHARRYCWPLATVIAATPAPVFPRTPVVRHFKPPFKPAAHSPDLSARRDFIGDAHNIPPCLSVYLAPPSSEANLSALSGDLVLQAVGQLIATRGRPINLQSGEHLVPGVPKRS